MCLAVQGFSVKKRSKIATTADKRPVCPPAASEISSGYTLLWQMDPQAIHVSQRMPSTILNVTQGAVLLLLVSSASHIWSHSSPQQSQSWLLAILAVANWNVILCTSILLNTKLLRIASLCACKGQLCDHCQGVIAGGRAGPQATPPDCAVENRGGVKPGCVHIGKALLVRHDGCSLIQAYHLHVHGLNGALKNRHWNFIGMGNLHG